MHLSPDSPPTDVKALLRPNQPSSNASLPPFISRKSLSFFQNICTVGTWPVCVSMRIWACVRVAMCDDITRGAEGEEAGKRKCLELKPYDINYPARHSFFGKRLNAHLVLPSLVLSLLSMLKWNTGYCHVLRCKCLAIWKYKQFIFFNKKWEVPLIFKPIIGKEDDVPLPDQQPVGAQATIKALMVNGKMVAHRENSHADSNLFFFDHIFSLSDELVFIMESVCTHTPRQKHTKEGLCNSEVKLRGKASSVWILYKYCKVIQHPPPSLAPSEFWDCGTLLWKELASGEKAVGWKWFICVQIHRHAIQEKNMSGKRSAVCYY